MKNEKKKQNRRGFFEERLVLGLIVILFGIIIVFFVPADIFFYIAIIIGLLIILQGSREILGICYRSACSEMTTGSPGCHLEDRLLALLYNTAMMWAYFVGAIGIFLFLVTGSNGQSWFLLILAPPGMFDGIAFIAGKRAGKHKIRSLGNTSSQKSWEGTIAGAIACIILTLAILLVKFPYLEYWQMAIVVLIIPLCAFFGDLIESKYKRVMLIKDSGTILRGHGGLLDRVDSMLLTAYGVFILTFWFL